MQLHECDKIFMFESQAPTGRCPEVWDLPPTIHLIEHAQSVMLPASMCEYGLAPSDEPNKRYRKNCWILVNPRLLPAAWSLSKTCTGSHDTVQLQGCIPGTGVSRTRGAAEYTEE